MGRKPKKGSSSPKKRKNTSSTTVDSSELAMGEDWSVYDPEVNRVGIDLIKSPLPERSMAADWVGVFERHDELNLVFGHLMPFESRLIAALQVSMTYRQVYEILYAGNPDFFSTIENYVKGQTVDIDDADAMQFPTDRFIKERATLALISFAGDDGDIAFYQVSASNLRRHKMKVDGAELIRPSVLVTMSSKMLYTLLMKLKALVPFEEEGENV